MPKSFKFVFKYYKYDDNHLTLFSETMKNEDKFIFISANKENPMIYLKFI